MSAVVSLHGVRWDSGEVLSVAPDGRVRIRSRITGTEVVYPTPPAGPYKVDEYPQTSAPAGDAPVPAGAESYGGAS